MSTLTRGQVEDVLTRFAAAYAAKDVAGLLALMSTDSDVMVVGTGADEVRVGVDAIRAQYERDIGEVDEIALAIGSKRVTVHGDAAWVYAEATLTAASGGQQIAVPPLRMTIVLAADGNDVLIKHVHVSVAWGEQQEGKSFPSL